MTYHIYVIHYLVLLVLKYYRSHLLCTMESLHKNDQGYLLLSNKWPTYDTGRNRNLKTSKALLKSQAHQGTSLFTSAATNQRWAFRRVVERSSGPISRQPGGDRVTE